MKNENTSKSIANFLKEYFLRKIGNNTFGGHLLADTGHVYDLGSSAKPMRAIYADECNCGSGSGGGLPQLIVTPTDNIWDFGDAGSDFTYLTIDYTITNSGSSSVDWTIEHVKEWVDISSVSGTLAPSDSTVVTVSVNANATYDLSIGQYMDVILFIANGMVTTARYVTLDINSVPSLSLQVTPTASTNLMLYSGGGGDITYYYDLYNNGTGNLNWIAIVVNNRIGLSETSGYLAAGDFTSVLATVDSAMYSEAVGNYNDIVNFYIEAA